jgi:hypothetical protein
MQELIVTYVSNYVLIYSDHCYFPDMKARSLLCIIV